MSRLKNERRASRSINYYILLSALVHMPMFLFTNLKEDIALGDKMIPIEIIDIPSVPSQGEYFKRQETQAVKKTQRKLIKEKEIKKKEERKKEKGSRKAGSTGTEPNRTNHHRGEKD